MKWSSVFPKSLEETVNKELKNVCEWLHVNKLTLNIKKSNFVIFRPPKRLLNYEITLVKWQPGSCRDRAKNPASRRDPVKKYFSRRESRRDLGKIKISAGI